MNLDDFEYKGLKLAKKDEKKINSFGKYLKSFFIGYLIGFLCLKALEIYKLYNG